MKFSLLTLLGAVAVAAVGCAALANPVRGSAMAVVTGTVLFLFGAVLAAIYCKAATRAFWTGFVILGWGYLLLVWVCFHDDLTRNASYGHILATTWALISLGEATIGTAPDTDDPFGGVGVEQVLEWTCLLQIGQALWALLLAFGGGVLARWLYLRRERHS